MSNTEKFRKLAAPPPAPPPARSTGGSSAAAKLLNYFKNFGINLMGQDAENFDERELKEALEYLAGLTSGWTLDRYKPSAFQYALEMDKNRGYKDTALSQGAVEMRNPTQQAEIEAFKRQHPSGLKDLLTEKPIENLDNINVDESSDRYKAMKEKLFGDSTANTNTKFIKTSQKRGVDEFKKIVPQWTINDVLADMAKQASRQDISNAEKQRNMMNVLSEYEKDIAPLSRYLKSNDIKYK